ncbi:MAG: outer membrane protein transport protein [Acidobacteria bacterium]|nr:outer membrane protein transport protein [Acidobacteriota bacterium]
MLTRSRRGVTFLALAASSLALLPRDARAAGFALWEQGARSMGFAGAFTAQASDPSAIFHNVAGIAFLKGKQVHLGGALIAPRSSFAGADPFPGGTVTEKGDAGLIVPPVADYSHQLTERLVVGVGFHVPFGLKTQWQDPEGFTGRFISKRAELQGFSVNPVVAYKLADRLAVGGGVDLRFASVELQRNVAAINPFTLKAVDVAAVTLASKTNRGIGFNVGLLAKPSESISFGVSYRHKVKIDFDGTSTFTLLPTGNGQLDVLVARSLPSGAIPVATSVEFPGILSGGVAYTRGDWTVEGDVNWYQWSSFDELPLTFEGRPDLSGVIEEHYEDSFQYRLGIERRLTDRWTVRGGYFFDETPTPTASVGPLLPDANRHGVAVGGSWQKGRFRVDVANWYLFFQDRSTDGLNRDNYNGIYESSAELFAVSIGYGF